MDLSNSDILGLMVAARSDEAMTERLKILQEALAAIEAAKAENEKIAQASTRDKNEAARFAAVAETRHQNAAGKERELAVATRNLADAQATIQADKAAWEKIRKQVDEEQFATAAQLLKREESLDDREAHVTKREVEIKAREEAVAMMGHHAAVKIAAMRAALDAT